LPLHFAFEREPMEWVSAHCPGSLAKKKSYQLHNKKTF